MHWDEVVLTFSVIVPSGGYGDLTLMPPNCFDSDLLGVILMDGVDADYKVQTIAGILNEPGSHFP